VKQEQLRLIAVPVADSPAGSAARGSSAAASRGPEAPLGREQLCLGWPVRSAGALDSVLVKGEATPPGARTFSGAGPGSQLDPQKSCRTLSSSDGDSDALQLSPKRGHALLACIKVAATLP
jgi:hypothetical protein